MGLQTEGWMMARKRKRPGKAAADLADARLDDELSELAFGLWPR
jgi:hypothetical protein